MAITKRQNIINFSDGAEPTVAIYFGPAAAGHHSSLLQRFSSPRLDWLPEKMARRLVRGSHILICRSLTTRWIDFLSSNRSLIAGISYLCDDDLAAGSEATELPSEYRERLGKIMHEQWPRLLNLADELVVTSRALARRFANEHRKVALLEPTMILPPPCTGHFSRGELTLLFHGTRAHLFDFFHIAPAVLQLLKKNEGIRLESLLGRFTPEAVRNHPKVRCIEPMPWPKFRQFMARKRVHIGLVPLLETPFNSGKSHVKFLEIASMGGVGVYSRRPPYEDIVEHGVDGLLVEDDPRAWLDALQSLVHDREWARQMAEAAGEKARRIGDPVIASRFWQARARPRVM